MSRSSDFEFKIDRSPFSPQLGVHPRWRRVAGAVGDVPLPGFVAAEQFLQLGAGIAPLVGVGVGFERLNFLNSATASAVMRPPRGWRLIRLRVVVMLLTLRQPFAMRGAKPAPAPM